MATKSDGSPILNGPYEEPDRHYATDADGGLNYADARPGRRLFVPHTRQVPLVQRQAEMPRRHGCRPSESKMADRQRKIGESESLRPMRTCEDDEV